VQIIRVPRARGVKRGVTVGCRRSQKKLYSIFSAEGRSKLYVPYIVRREERTSLELPRFVSFVRYCILSFGMPIGHKSLSAYIMKPPRAVRWFHSFVCSSSSLQTEFSSLRRFCPASGKLPSLVLWGSVSSKNVEECLRASTWYMERS
jgi:hypothetical protein